MLELKISNMYIDSYVDFQKQNFDSTLLEIKPIHQDNHGMAFDSALLDVIAQISDVSTSVAINLFSSWLIIQAEKNNMTPSFRLNGRKLLEEELKSKELLNKILEEELKTIKLKKKIEKEKN